MTMEFVLLNPIEKDWQGISQTYLQHHSTSNNKKLEIVCLYVKERGNKSQHFYSMEFYAAVQINEQGMWFSIKKS